MRLVLVEDCKTNKCQEEVDRILDLHDKGYGYAAISRRILCDVGTVKKIVNVYR